jgi:hypothetical protein
MTGKFTAILFAGDYLGSGETLTMSRTVKSDSKKTIYTLLKKEAKVDDDQVDTILVLRNGDDGPEVFHHWRASNADFENL